MTSDQRIPGGELTGQVGTWRLPARWSERAADDSRFELDPGDPGDPGSGHDNRVGTLTLEDATFLGVGSSRQERHFGHPSTRYAPKPTGKGEGCGACRWFETRIFKLGDNEYVLHHAGRSIVPGEQDLCRYEEAFSPYEVIERYTVRNNVRPPFITRPALLALAQAASFDSTLRDAYENRAVI